MIHLRSLSYLAFTGSVCLSSSIVTSRGEEPVIAKVGETEVKVSDVREWFGGLDEAQIAVTKADPSRLSEAVRAILVQRLLNLEAEEKGWSKEPEISALIERQRAKLIAESYLRSVSQPDEDFPSEVELTKAYETAGDSLMQPARFRLAQIFIASPGEGKSIAAQETELAEIRKKLAAPTADFAAIARAHSEEVTSAGKGGDLGWLQEDLIQPEIRTAVENLTKGEVSKPVRMSGGWHIIKVLDRESARRPTLDEIRPQLSARLREQHVQAASQAYLAQILRENPVVINEIELPKVLENSKDQ